MNRRSFLRGLVALPFLAPVAQRVQPYIPWMGVKTGTQPSRWLGGGLVWRETLEVMSLEPKGSGTITIKTGG